MTTSKSLKTYEVLGVDHTQAPDPTVTRRFHELDSLRGLAALSVVFLHFHDLWTLSDPRSLPKYQYILLAILRPFYSGSEAVVIFFVLSGLVLALPYISGRPQPYRVYLLRRVLRICGPYWVALLIALGCDALWFPHAFYGTWAQHVWVQPVALRPVLEHVILIDSFIPSYLFVAWTLVHEMRLSIVFPLVVGFCLKVGNRTRFLAAIVLSAIFALWGGNGDTTHHNLLLTLHVCALFIVGILIALNLRWLEASWSRLTMPGRMAVLAVSCMTYFFDGHIVDFLLPRLFHHGVSDAVKVVCWNWCTAIGALGFIVMSLMWSPLSRMLNGVPARFLGRISYSLYLLHPIVLFSLRFACGDRVSMWGQLLIYLPATLFLSWLFCIGVEETFIRLGRNLRKPSPVGGGARA